MGKLLLRREWWALLDAGLPGWESCVAEGSELERFLGADRRRGYVVARAGDAAPQGVTVMRAPPDGSGPDRLPELRRWCRRDARGAAYVAICEPWLRVLLQLREDVALFRCFYSDHC